MEKQDKEHVLEILNYWKFIEFLGQSSIPDTKTKSKNNNNKLEVFHDLSKTETNIKEVIEYDDESYQDNQSLGAEVYFCFGEIKRNTIVEYLNKHFEISNDESPELSYKESEKIAWFSFKADTEGNYIDNSFQLSPVLWTLSKFKKAKSDKITNFKYPNIKDYKQTVDKFNKSLQEKNILDFLDKLYNKMLKEFAIEELLSSEDEDQADRIGFFEYNRYTSEENRTKDTKPTDYSDLSKSFFLNDIDIFIDAIKNNNFGGNKYETRIISYILAAYSRNSDTQNLKRVNISPKEPEEKMEELFKRVLSIENAPMGKWPSRFMPALMQQFAINIAIQSSDAMPIFSVNGPPGTGKTTMLKEIIANNIVKRALLLTEDKNSPESIFEKRSFIDGPNKDSNNSYFKFAPHYYSIKNDKINEFSVLIASCNNAAVENITKDLPNGDDIIKSLDCTKDDCEETKTGLREIKALFNYKNPPDEDIIKVPYSKDCETRKDIFFKEYADDLLGQEKCWGLISAPLGKRANINNYCEKVLNRFYNNYNYNKIREKHKKQFELVRQEFLKQYEHVKKLGKELQELANSISLLDTEYVSSSKEELLRKKESLKSKKLKFAEELNYELNDLKHLKREKILQFLPSSNKTKSKSARNELIKEKERAILSLKNKINDADEEFKKINDALEFHSLIDKHPEGRKTFISIDKNFMQLYTSQSEEGATKAQISNPWFTQEYNREREKLFNLACRVHKEFVVSSKPIMQNVINLLIAWEKFNDCDNRMSNRDKQDAMPHLLQSVFLITPVISTTFASVESFLNYIKKPRTFGTLIIDEAGQAQPQMALGAMFRCRKAIIVGDPKQIEPIVKGEEIDMFKQLYDSKVVENYKDKNLSVQTFADHINPYGTMLGSDDEMEWVGCPLIVHRRCIDPMYSISNELSYDKTMKQQTNPPNEEKKKAFILDNSCWIDVKGTEVSGMKNHYVEDQGKVVLNLLKRKIINDPNFNSKLFIISPFTSVKDEVRELIRKSDLCAKNKSIGKWTNANIGTVHTFQGKDADEVIFLLGCDSRSPGAIKWVKKNIVNVAVTRAKFRLYIIGDKTIWNSNPSLKLALSKMPEVINSNDLIEMQTI